MAEMPVPKSLSAKCADRNMVAPQVIAGKQNGVMTVQLTGTNVPSAAQRKTKLHTALKPLPVTA